jgi:hypothetical protein
MGLGFDVRGIPWGQEPGPKVSKNFPTWRRVEEGPSDFFKKIKKFI